MMKDFESPALYYGIPLTLGIEDIDLSAETSLFHVTHRDEAEKIYNENGFQASDNKNILNGVWFGIEDPEHTEGNVYGSMSFSTTLRQLGIRGLYQGEIVSYKREVKVILYATDDYNKDFIGLKKPTDDAAKRKIHQGSYVKISIFVPERFLPTNDHFSEIITGPKTIEHGPFCVRQKRSDEYKCEEFT